MTENLLVDMSVNDLADFVFTKNYENKSIQMHISGLEDTQDLFCFCLDLLCKGLVLLFGTDNKVSVNDLTGDQFHIIREKMKCIGIDCMLEMFSVELPAENFVDLWTQNYMNMERIRTEIKSQNLEDYQFNLQTLETIYQIKFKLLPVQIPHISPNKIL